MKRPTYREGWLFVARPMSANITDAAKKRLQTSPATRIIGAGAQKVFNSRFNNS